MYGYDQILDYKNDNLANTLTEACPKGVDIYFDNTGGPISDEVIQRLNVGARIIICGTASISNWNPVPHGPRIERQILVKRARIRSPYFSGSMSLFETSTSLYFNFKSISFRTSISTNLASSQRWQFDPTYNIMTLCCMFY